MANLASSAVTVNKSWFAGLKKELIHRNVTVVLSGHGTAANAITAESMNVRRFEGVSNLTKADDSEVILGVPSYDGSKLLLKAVASNAPAAFTGTYSGLIIGR